MSTQSNFKNIHNEVQYRSQRLQTVAKVSQAARSILDVTELINTSVNLIRDQFDFYCVNLYMVDEAREWAILRAGACESGQVQLVNERKIKIGGESVIDWCIQNQQARIALNVGQEAVDFLNPDLPNTHWEMALPLIHRNRVIGALLVQSTERGAFSDEDIILLQTIADQLAVAIENARLFEERDRRMAELAVFNQIGAVISGSHSLEVMLPNILGWVSALFQVEGVSLMLLENDELRFAVATGPGAKNITSFTLKPGQGIAWSVVETGQTIRVDNVATDSRHFSEIDTAIDFKTQTLLAVPVQIHGKMLGVIEAINRLDGRSFNRDDEVTLEFIGSSVAIAIENARLFSETQRHIEQLAGLLEASHVINTLDLQDILNTIVHSVGTLLKAEYAVVYLADNDARQLRATVSHNSTEPAVNLPLHTFNFGEGTVGWTLEHRQLLRLNNVAKDDRFLSQIAVPKSITNLLSTPLIVKDDAIGVLEVANKLGGQDFTDEDETLLAAFGNQVAVAIYNARLFNEVNQRLAEVSTLYTFAGQMTRVMELSQVSQSTVTILKHALDCDGCCLFLYEKVAEAETLVLKASSGWHDQAASSLATDYLIELAQSLPAKPQPIHIRNVQEAAGSLKFAGPTQPRAKLGQPEMQMRSVMLVPLIVKDKLLGALSIDDNQPNAFGPSEGRLLTITAAQISTAIENIRLYDNLEQRAVELEMALNEAQEANRLKEVALDEAQKANRLKSEFVQNVSHELRTPLTSVQSCIQNMLDRMYGPLTNKQQERLETALASVREEARLIENLLDLVRIEEGRATLELETANITSIIHNVIKFFEYDAEQKNINLTSQFPDEYPLEARVDVHKIKQVVTNLINNAIKFTQEGGRINIIASRQKDKIQVWVEDSGCGIPKEKFKKIFERYYQADSSQTRKVGGIGIGLNLSKEHIKMHKGDIWVVNSEVGRGTIISFCLPVQ